MKGDVFLDYLRRHPSAALTLRTLISDLLRWANQRRLEFAGYDSDVCLARLLLAVVARHGRPAQKARIWGPVAASRARRPLIGAKESTVEPDLQFRIIPAELRSAG